MANQHPTAPKDRAPRGHAPKGHAEEVAGGDVADGDGAGGNVADGRVGWIGRAARGFLVTLIYVYQGVTSVLPKGACRFEPNCSAYGLEAVRVHGALRGGGLTLKRILRCRPGGGFGVDPVPPAGSAGRVRAGPPCGHAHDPRTPADRSGETRRAGDPSAERRTAGRRPADRRPADGRAAR